VFKPKLNINNPKMHQLKHIIDILVK